MEGEPNDYQALLCRAGCGFFGNWSTNGLCSLCYKKIEEKKGLGDGQGPTAVAANPSDTNIVCSGGQDNSKSLNMCSAFTTSTSGASGIDQIGQELSKQDHSGDSGNTNKEQEMKDVSTEVASASGSDLQHDVSFKEVVPTSSTTIPNSNTLDKSTNTDLTASASVISSPETPTDERKSKSNRCSSCRKKIGLTGFDCRCGKKFCGLHRYSDTHDCSFDYRQLGAEEIKKNNPVVVREKVQKL